MGFQVTEVQKALKGIEYPTDSEGLAETAEQNGSNDELVISLRELEGDEFTGPDDVMAAMKGQLGGESS